MALTCRIELHKTKGVTVTVEDAQAKTSQTVVLDGTSLVFTCKDQQHTSTITQKSDSIEVKCKSFTVDAETVALKSQKASTWDSDDKLSLTSKSDFAVSSSTKASVKGKKEVSLSGAKLAAEGTNQASLSGGKVSVKGDNKAEVNGASVEVAARMTLDLKGMIVKAAAQGALTAEGQATTVKGQMLNLQGTMVKLG